MKKRFTKLVSSVLILAFLISAFSVLAFANTGSTESHGAAAVSESGMELIINRPYDEGWGYSNGFGTNEVGDHKYTIDYEEDENSDYNYFCRIESTDVTTGYLELTYGSNAPELTYTILEMDLKLDDVNNIGTLGYMRASNNR